MSEKDSNANDGGDGKPSKIVRERKAKIKTGPESFRYGPGESAPTKKYGPCSFEVSLATRTSIGAPEEAAPVRAFCESFNTHTDICSVKGYSVADGCWTVTVDLATNGKDVDDTFISEMFRKFKPAFDASPVLKREFAAGKARYVVRNGGTNVLEGDLN